MLFGSGGGYSVKHDQVVCKIKGGEDVRATRGNGAEVSFVLKVGDVSAKMLYKNPSFDISG